MLSKDAITPPQSADVVIIGGGIIGISTALTLSRAGVKAVVLEKGQISAEQSSRNWGWVRTLGREPAEIPIALRASSLWAELQSKIDVGYRRNGLLYLERTERDHAGHQAWLSSVSDYGLNARMLGSKEIREMVPGAQRSWHAALYNSEDGVANPLVATKRIADLARDIGTGIFENCAARGLERSAGAVSAVITEAGTIKASTVLIAAGAWSRLFCGNEGIEFPQLKVRGSVLRTAPFDAGFAVGLNGVDFTCSKRPDGGYTISRLSSTLADVVPDSFRLMGKFWKAWLNNRMFIRVHVGRRFFEEAAIPRRFSKTEETPFERCRVLDPCPHSKMLGGAWKHLTEAIPVFQKARVIQSWGGYMDVTPDAMPVISAVNQIPGLYLSSGFSGHGFGIGPAAGEATAELILGNPTKVDLAAFSMARFH